MRIAQLQLPVFKEKRDNLVLMEKTIREIVSLPVDFVALPEMFCCPYQVTDFPLYAEKEQGPVWYKCSETARKYHIYLSAGSMPEKDESGHIYNTAYIFDRDGNQIAKHRKVHLFDIDVKGGQRFKESETLSAGDTITTFHTEFGTFGLCICYDFRFPEMGRLMALRGAQAIFVPAAFNMTTGPAHWEIMFRSQSMYNQIFAVGTAPARNAAAAYISWGHSIVTDPWGQVIHQIDEKQGVSITELDLLRVREVREQLPLLRHRRADVYEVAEKPRRSGNQPSG